MTMKLFNSLTKQVEPLVPIRDNQVGMYVCGMTVYDYCHIGHGRLFVVYDVLYRLLQALGFEVTYVRNITDIDDKIIKRANDNGETIQALTERFIAYTHEDERALNVLPPDIEPRATEYVEPMIALIQQLIALGHAYVTSSGDVCYDVKSFAGYGKLSKRNLDDLQAGSRVDVDDGKRHPADFVLWKMSKPEEPAWSSPWGMGRPGWHTECAVMTKSNLGQPFDIHGGGIDLKFPHHDNEIAQAEPCGGCHYANMWVHMGHVQVNDEKMSKSLGNFLTIRDAIQQYSAEMVRYFLLSAHYRSPINFSKANMDNAKQALTRIYTALNGVATDASLVRSEFSERFFVAMQEDMNTVEALAVIFDLVRALNSAKAKEALDQASLLAVELKYLCGILGFGQLAPSDFLQGEGDDELVAQVDALIAARNAARAAKDWAKADELRDALLALGVSIKDGAEGTTWTKV